MEPPRIGKSKPITQNGLARFLAPFTVITGETIGGVPRIEIADHRNTGGIFWSPHRKSHAADAVDGQTLRAKTLAQLEMPAFVE